MAAPQKFYEGSNMRPYGMTWGGYYVDMGARAEMYGPRTPGFFENGKLSVRHISGDFDSFVAWVDEEHYYTDHGVIHAVPYHVIKAEAAYTVTAEQESVSERYPLFFLLGTLMSRPAMELYAELYATGSLQGAFSHVYPNMVKGLPIPKLDQAPPEAPKDWFSELAAESQGGRFSRAAVRRAFATRAEVAAVIASAARRRQEVEQRRGQRRQDFIDFMQLHRRGWRWMRGKSLETPPDEIDFLRTVGAGAISINTMTTVRAELRSASQAAADDAQEAVLLQAMIDALAESLYAP